ncbi:uncharacterized protein [Lolium perenne]|uniref:uncharacterized protein n=1 Tax=Lolium perenne TaxID=4522 RepID=UPI003A9A35A7
MGVRARPSGTFYAEIRAGGARLTLGTFATVEQRCTPTTWRHGASGAPANKLNFKDRESLGWLRQPSSPPSGAATAGRFGRRLAIAHADERAMEAWAAAFPRDILDERAFYEQKKADRRAEKEAIRAGKPFIEVREVGPTTIDGNNDC